VSETPERLFTITKSRTSATLAVPGFPALAPAASWTAKTAPAAAAQMAEDLILWAGLAYAEALPRSAAALMREIELLKGLVAAPGGPIPPGASIERRNGAWRAKVRGPDGTIHVEGAPGFTAASARGAIAGAALERALPLLGVRVGHLRRAQLDWLSGVLRWATARLRDAILRECRRRA